MRKEQEAVERAAAAENAENAESGENQENGESTAENTNTTIQEESSLNESKEEKRSDAGAATQRAESPVDSILSDKMITVNEDGDVIVDPDHAEIKMAVDKAMEESEKMSVSLPTEVYIKALESELQKLRQHRLKNDPTAPK